ncbi:SRPBCC family protein [Streptomyces rubradiris]|uniref:Polyketide cyclase n=1 Tax=Streptomyces rubradiris TaxID=285531 RepID=A0ABQ3R5U2_STRRR|nr:SRPBCC family protein [Streptomyces rubradiris]GHH14820.1 polyketide cyclase [Streptomyces rubradiris]GHI51209.1 polyketide cyclase [Streptomyces rubradiris]
MDPHHYRFHSTWPLPATPAAVYAVLERADDYPRWWPQVRSATRLAEHTGLIVIRSALPLALTATLRQTRRDPAAGVLEAALSGDLQGWARWTITADGPGTLAHYEQDVRVARPLFRRLALPGRPLFRLNHRLMMRAGRRGLLRRLDAV